PTAWRERSSLTMLQWTFGFSRWRKAHGTMRRVHHGVSLRHLRQEAVVRHERLPLAPSHQATLEPEHPARARTCERRAKAPERVHRMSSLRQGHQAFSLESLRLTRGDARS